ncbi:MAG TPA: ATP synthase F1 subunit epsilon [Anaerolineae bacterium]|nr:ATP synthase F1 subunit epsilon [Anaerolineae bacterium]
MSTTRLEILTPDNVVLSEEVTSIRIQLADGWWGILPHHAPFIAELPVGLLIYRKNGERHYIVLAGGTVEVQPEKVLILTAAAEMADEVAALEKAIEERRAEEEKVAFQAHIEFERARATLLRALTEEEISKR